MEKNNSDNAITQEILMSNRIGSIAMLLAKRLDIAPIRALKLFYESKTCTDLHNRDTALYLYSDPYIADEFIIENTSSQ